MIINPRIIAVVSLIGLVCIATIMLAARTIPAPAHPTEKVIKNDRFFK